MRHLRPLQALCAALLAAGAVPAGVTSPPPRMLIACAPGYPGTTAQAQVTMDGFARAATAAAGWKEGSLGAVYHETLSGGVRRLAEKDAVLALVTLPVFLQEETGLGLKPQLKVVQEAGDDERFSLVARKGAVSSAAGLVDWEITGSVGYSPAFVRGAVLGGWGTIPAGTRITFAPAALSALRRAAAGEKLAVVLDAAGMAALPSLPFASDLEVVTQSPPLPGSLLCAVGQRLPPRDLEKMVRGLAGLHQEPGGAEALRSIRIARFESVDRGALDSIRAAVAKASVPAR